MQRAAAWMRWELNRRIELTLGHRLIIIDRFVKAVVLVLGGIVLLIAERTGALAQLTERLQTELNVSPGSHLWLRLTSWLLEHVATLSGGAQTALAIAAMLYGLLEAFEGFGLILHRRWAEYLVLLATCAFIPLEVDELARHPTVWKAVAFLINVAIVVYLVRRKRLFLERPPLSASPT